MKKVHPKIPAWLEEALACHECGKPCGQSPSGYMVCVSVPAHTGLICKDYVDHRIGRALASAKSLGAHDANISREEAINMAWMYLQSHQRF